MSSTQPAPEKTTTPWFILCLIMLAPFAFSTGAFVFGGLLAPMAGDLDASLNATAQLQTAFTLACALGGPALAILLRAWDKRRLLIAVLIFMTAINLASALAPGYLGLLAARVLGGLVGALTVPLASALAVGFVPPEMRGRALAIVNGGTALAFLVGIPIGSLIGGEAGWRAAFVFAAVLSALVALLMIALVPQPPQAAAPPTGKGPSVLAWPLPGLYAATLLSFTATFAAVGLIGPIISALTGLTGGAVGAMQIMIGLGSILGLGLGAVLAERRGAAALIPLTVVIAVTQAIYALGLWTGMTGTAGTVLFAAATLPGAAALFATTPVIAASIAQHAGVNATLAFALNGATIFFGQSLGIALGGLGLALGALAAAPLLGTGVALIALIFLTRSRLANPDTQAGG